MNMRRHLLCMAAAWLAMPGNAQTADSTETEMRQVEVLSVRQSRSMGLENKEVIGRPQLIRAACCNLGESFTNSASVDVSYSDPTTGVRQVKLLGLSGTYVQMMTENIPAFRGVAGPYALGLVPGPWLSSIQVSKGASSVKNGYESMTGQINIEYLKPQSDNSLHVNAYLNNKLAYEWNADVNRHFGESERWSAALLAHGNQNTMQRDMNADGFRDEPTGYQYNVMGRVAYVSPRYIMQLRASGIWDKQEGGEKNRGSVLAHQAGAGYPWYLVKTDNRHWNVHLKNAYVFNSEKDGNVALILSTEGSSIDARYGNTASYNVGQGNWYASLLFEEQFTPRHALSAGLSLVHDQLRDEKMMDQGTWYWPDPLGEETTPGAYAQYTYSLDDELTLMAGLRADHSSLFGTFVTPRAHLRWHPAEWLTVRASAGKGYRTPHMYAETHYLMGSSRVLTIPMGEIKQEESWNTGTSWQLKFPLWGRKLDLNIDYYYTRFQQQMVVDRDASSRKILLYALPDGGRSFSHCLQVDATYPFFQGFELTAAWRMNHARTTYQDGRLRELPLTNRWKGLLTATYKTPLELWQFDVTCQLNGPGRMPDPYMQSNGEWSWQPEYKAFPQLSAQVTRFFRWGSIYAGGENLTNYHLKHPIIDAGNPHGLDFDSNMIWGPVHGAMGYVGFRFNIDTL